MADCIYRKIVTEQKYLYEISYNDTKTNLRVFPRNFYQVASYHETKSWGKYSDTVPEKDLHMTVILITEGECLLQRGRNRQILHAGDLALRIPLTRLACLDGKPFSRVSVTVRYDYKDLFYSMNLDPDRILKLTPDDLPYVKRIFSSIREAVTGNDPMQVCEISANFYKLLFLLLNLAQNSEPKTGDWILFCIDYAPHLYTSLKKMMEKFQVSRPTLTKLFRERKNTTPMEYVNKLRFKYVAGFLVHEDTPVNKIAEQYGFQDLPYFFRQFKKRYGMTPLQYRKEMKKSNRNKI